MKNKVLRSVVAALERRDVDYQQDGDVPEKYKAFSELVVALGQLLEQSDMAEEADELCREILPLESLQLFEVQVILDEVKVRSAWKASQH